MSHFWVEMNSFFPYHFFPVNFVCLKNFANKNLQTFNSFFFPALGTENENVALPFPLLKILIITTFPSHFAFEPKNKQQIRKFHSAFLIFSNSSFRNFIHSSPGFIFPLFAIRTFGPFYSLTCLFFPLTILLPLEYSYPWGTNTLFEPPLDKFTHPESTREIAGLEGPS